MLAGLSSVNAGKNTLNCVAEVSKNTGALEHAKEMAACIRQKNGFLENWRMRSTFQVIDTMPNAPKEFVGTWRSGQSNCIYRHELGEDGGFVSTPMKCNMSNSHYRGKWGVHKDKMIWLANEVKIWPPDINTVRWIDKDSFTLTEFNGTVTEFSRVYEKSSPVAPPPAR
ncbi:MAG: hypothetical protein LBE06_07510 [Azoarcus sp.]|nr:hypothetical protein [Azoarcus sp.]